MDYHECITQEILTRTPPDLERAKHLVALADLRLSFWSKQDDQSVAVLHIEAWYEIIKELIFAHMYANGYNCSNHVCLIAYLQKQFDDFSFEIQKIDELRKIRNEIAYRGVHVKQDYLVRNKTEFKHITTYLRKAISSIT